MSCAPRPSDSCLPASAAELREPATSTFGRSTSPFGADGPSCPHLPAMAHQTPHQAQAGLVPTWGESSFGIHGLGGSECGSGSMWDCEPVAPARPTAEGLDALSFAFIQSQQPQDQLINRPGLSVSEHPCTLLRAPSGGYSLINTTVIATAAPLDAAAVILPQLKPAAAAAAAAVPAAAATPACSESLASPAASTDHQQHHGATSAPTSSGATSSCGGSDMPEDAAAEVQQRAPEAAAAALQQSSHAFAASSAAAAAEEEEQEEQEEEQEEVLRPAAVEQVGLPGTAALAAMRASSRVALAAAAASALPARAGQKRRAAATAAAVVLEAAREDEDDDEDYDEREEAGGAAGRANAKRVKRVGAPRATTNKPKTGVTCRNCRATETPQWRCGPEGPRTLCNACGVRYKKGQTLEYMAKKAAAAAARGRTGGDA
ncbi:hypothetical protein HXX76_008704 [Chlamydomonas incerta]|uniref:GATA-type domain-containing protein n=1 Tax=Chlamydomonas incerta TaxID=51695 RepID=A0A835SWA8_CHLIN|nr:hypothetical protein HXX76_008704 [Chlamydomonas incerta]|eukprot:KAG2432976.1 hypothetical protein HXX76_008704 [Chlamydomonas incerta]